MERGKKNCQFDLIIGRYRQRKKCNKIQVRLKYRMWPESYKYNLSNKLLTFSEQYIEC